MPELDEDRRLTGEAEAQSEQTIMPWFWGGVGVLVIALFVIWTIFGGSLHRAREPPATTSVTRHAY
jgi:hypothetical protein